ncbi:MAG: hypothetical protein RBS49_03405 [Sphaerochaeta sp.]|nr:hypothetical protein [Sphaerochaeta sp.]MDX9914915.1 hypothetical protein [Sphaerochaeta sp.]
MLFLHQLYQRVLRIGGQSPTFIQRRPIGGEGLPEVEELFFRKISPLTESLAQRRYHCFDLFDRQIEQETRERVKPMLEIKGFHFFVLCINDYSIAADTVAQLNCMPQCAKQEISPKATLLVLQIYSKPGKAKTRDLITGKCMLPVRRE